MTYKEINDKLKELSGSVNEAREILEYPDEETEKIFGKIESIDSYGGEGQGETYYNIFFFPEHDVYLRIDGFYSSYEGVDYIEGWDSISQVKPKQKTITVYE